MEIMRLNLSAEKLIGKFLAVWYAWNIFLRCNGGGYAGNVAYDI